MRALIAFLVVCMAPSVAHAIPSPDVVVNVFTGAAQGLVVLGTALSTVVVAFLRCWRKPERALRRFGMAFLVLGLLVSLAYNALQHRSTALAKQQRLSRNLVRSSVQNGQAVWDVSLKVLPISEQLSHPLGLTTSQVAELAQSNPDVLLVDVREDEEFEAGAIARTLHLRYPDLQQDRTALLAASTPPVLMCYSGNRSGELAQAFSDENIPCRFMIGGYEKWGGEGRPLVGRNGEARNARDIAAYPNKDLLLETEEVEELFSAHDVVFIDARYPAEFQAGHLPGAVNIPLRKLTSREVEDFLGRVPEGKSLIGVCYDKRSSFYSLLLGSKLSRRGHTWLGRYTLPAEFVAPRKSEVVDEGWSVASLLGALLQKTYQWTGSVILAILFAVLGLRLLMAPVSYKAEASVASERRVRDRLAELKKQFENHAGERRKQIQELQRSAGVKPLWSLTSGLLQAFLFITFAVTLSDWPLLTGAAWGWIPAFDQADPRFVLPAAIAVLAWLQMRCSGKFSSRRGLLTSSLLALVFFGLTRSLGAAVNFAIVINLAVSVAFSLWFVGQDRRLLRRRVPAELRPSTGIVALSGSHYYQGVGPKAHRLGRLLAEGLPVPGGFVLTHGLLQNAGHPRQWTAGQISELLRAFDGLSAAEVAVRSSALDEDGQDQSFAGIFESKLDVTRAEMISAVEFVVDSFSSQVASSYTGDKDAGACILVQEMVQPDYAGVLFTRHPRYPAEIAIEYVEGCGESLVSGAREPQRLSVGRESGQIIESQIPEVPFAVSELLRLGLRCEEVFGRPQDVEWAVKGGKFYVLQSRDITASAAQAGSKTDWIEGERLRLLESVRDRQSGAEPLRRDSFSELLPFPTPASLSLVRTLLGRRGAAHRVRQKLGMPYAPDHARDALTTVFGRLFVDADGMARLYPRKGLRGLLQGLVSTLRCHRRRELFTSEWLNAFSAKLERDLRLGRSRNLDGLGSEDLCRILMRRVKKFTRKHYLAAEELNVIAAYQEGLTRSVVTKAGLPLSVMASHAGESITTQGERMLREVAEGDRDLREYLAEFGHRAAVDYELSLPRFSEDPTPIERMVATLRGTEAKAAKSSSDHLLKQLPVKVRARVDQELLRFGELSALKESARHHVLKSLALIRAALVAIGRTTGLDDDVFYLDLEEIEKLCNDPTQLFALTEEVQRRRALRSAFQDFEAIDAEVALGAAGLERLGRISKSPAGAGDLVGTCVFGDEPVVGKARVLRLPQDVEQFQPGEVLVACYTDTSLAPLFGQARGLVTEVGGMLSHAAIVAREFGLPAIVGAARATQAIATGDLVELHPDGQVKVLSDERRQQRRFIRDHSLRVVTASGEEIFGTALDESAGGVLAQSSGFADLDVGHSVSIVLNGFTAVPAEVSRKQGADRLAFQFESLLPEVESPAPADHSTRRLAS